MISRPGESLLIDSIPLSEILNVAEMYDTHMKDLISHPITRASNLNTPEMGKKPNTNSDEDCVNLEAILHEHSKTRKFLANNNKINIQGLPRTLQIQTIPDGYNSGRTYYLRAALSDEHAHILKTLKKTADTARKRAEVKSQFVKAQSAVRTIHDSMLFQTASGILILAVRVLYADMPFFAVPGVTDTWSLGP
jgi:hypothetical protein